LVQRPLSLEDWQARFARQARWTKELREAIFQRFVPGSLARILEVGCGPGTLTAEIRLRTGAWVCGLDRQPRFLPIARRSDPYSSFVTGDGLALPFRSRSFNLVYCHFLLLWVQDPARALAEMARVTAPGGTVLALAEPDYADRIDYPQPLSELGRLQREALIAQGADPDIGRRLGELFFHAGLINIETGLLGGQWSGPPSAENWASEWQVLESDLQGRISPERLRDLRRLDASAWQHGERVLFVPTFYAIGRVR
jgi:SAM-dependent methyltransferase